MFLRIQIYLAVVICGCGMFIVCNMLKLLEGSSFEKVGANQIFVMVMTACFITLCMSYCFLDYNSGIVFLMCYRKYKNVHSAIAWQVRLQAVLLDLWKLGFPRAYVIFYKFKRPNMRAYQKVPRLSQ